MHGIRGGNSMNSCNCCSDLTRSPSSQNLYLLWQKNIMETSPGTFGAVVSKTSLYTWRNQLSEGFKLASSKRVVIFLANSEENQNKMKWFQMFKEKKQGKAFFSPCIGKTTSSSFLFWVKASYQWISMSYTSLWEYCCYEILSHIWMLYTTLGFAFNPKVLTSFHIYLHYIPIY